MQTGDGGSEVAQAKVAVRRAYEKPNLVEYGSIAKLTLAPKAKSTADMTSQMMVW